MASFISSMAFSRFVQVATRCPSSARMQLKPEGLSFARDLARHAEAEIKRVGKLERERETAVEINDVWVDL